MHSICPARANRLILLIVGLSLLGIALPMTASAAHPANMEPVPPGTPLTGTWLESQGQGFTFQPDPSSPDVVLGKTTFSMQYGLFQGGETCWTPIGWEFFRFTQEPNGQYQGGDLWASGNNECSPAGWHDAAAGREFRTPATATLEVIWLANIHPQEAFDVKINDDGSFVPTIDDQTVFSNLACEVLAQPVNGQPVGPAVLPADYCNWLERAWPSGGLGYIFKNDYMENFLQRANIPKEAIFNQDTLNSTFADIGALVPAEAGSRLLDWLRNFKMGWWANNAAPTFSTTFGMLWYEVNLGLCQGISLTTGLFASGFEPLFKPPARSDPTWPLEWNQSITRKLPLPQSPTSGEFSKQLLRELAIGTVSQFSSYVQGTIEHELQRYQSANPASYFREQLEAFMGLDSGFALLDLEVPSEQWGHAVLAYGLKEELGEVLKINVQDPNCPGTQPANVTVKPDGTWTFVSCSSNKQGNLASGSGYAFPLPLYSPHNLSYEPPGGALVIVNATGDVSSVAASGAASDPRQIPSGDEDAGQVFDVEGPSATMHLSAPGEIGVTGKDVFLSAATDDAASVTEDTSSGSISVTGAAGQLSANRGDQAAFSIGASSLTIKPDGGVEAVADDSGRMRTFVAYVPAQGEPREVASSDEATIPGQIVRFSAESLMRAEHPDSRGNENPKPAKEKRKANHHRKSPKKCRKAFKKKLVHGHERCVRRRHKHKHHRRHTSKARQVALNSGLIPTSRYESGIAPK